MNFYLNYQYFFHLFHFSAKFLRILVSLKMFKLPHHTCYISLIEVQKPGLNESVQHAERPVGFGEPQYSAFSPIKVYDSISVFSFHPPACFSSLPGFFLSLGLILFPVAFVQQVEMLINFKIFQ